MNKKAVVFLSLALLIVALPGCRTKSFKKSEKKSSYNQKQKSAKPKQAKKVKQKSPEKKQNHSELEAFENEMKK